MNRICVVSIYVENLDAARRFYIDQLGFELQQEYGDCIVRLGNEGITLLLERIEGDYPPAPCVIPAVEVTDLEAELAQLREAGVDLVHQDPQRFPAGRFIACRDGAGNLLEVLQFD